MTLLTTEDDLRSLAPGEAISVRGNNTPWLRTEAGFQRGQYTVQFEHFLPSLRGELLSRGVSPAIGQAWLEQYGYVHYITDIETIDGVQHYWCARFLSDGSNFGRVIRVRGTMAGNMIAEPEWLTPMVKAMSSTMVTLERQGEARQSVNEAEQMRLRNGWNEAVAETRRLAAAGTDGAVQEYRARLEPDLHRWMNDNGEDHDSALAGILEAHGMSRPAPEMESITVTVDIEGTTRVYLGGDTLGSALGFTVDDIDGQNVDVGWDHRLTIANIQVPEDECGCDQISRAQVEQALRDAGITWQGFETRHECTNC